MKKRLFATIISLAVATVLIVPMPAVALTADELQLQINQLLNQLSALQAQLGDLTGTPTTPAISGCTITSFNRNFSVGSTGADVKCLQIVLNSDTATRLASTGAGSPGNETTFFGPITKAGVVKFQEKYAATTLTPWGLTSGTGYVGTTTREKLNQLLVSSPTTPTVPTTPTDPTVPTTPGGLSVGLSATTPASATIATGANANFTKFSLTAGSAGAVNISRIYVTRSGLSANADVENIKIIDVATGEYKGSVGTLNVNSQALITFVPSLQIPAGTTKDFFIRAGIPTGTTAGKTVSLGIASVSDITSNAASVTGGAVIGNPMSIVSLTIGTITVSKITTIDSKPNVGDTDVDVSEFRLAAGSTEDVIIETVTVKKAGTATVSDSQNIELYDITNGVSLGTVANWSGDEKATWSNLNLHIEKGKNVRLKVRLDVVGGVSSVNKNINVDLIDGTDTLVVAKGNTYGFYITPTISGSWDGLGTAQEIQSGALTVTVSADTPATGNIAPGSDIVLAVFDFDAKGEDIKVSTLTVIFDTMTGLADSDITNVSIYDASGTIVAGPQNTSSAAVAYTDTIIIPIGVNKYTVKATIADSASTGNAVRVGIKTPNPSITAVGMISNDTIPPTPNTDVDANILTVAAGGLVVTTLADPAAKNIPAPASNVLLATFSLSAGSSGEDIRVTSITVTDSLGGAATYANITNAELWADLTSANSARGDVYETKISNTEQWSTATKAFALNQTLTIPKGLFRRVALVAGVVSGASGSHTFSIADATGNVSATGASTGETPTVTYATTSKQTMTVADSTLTVTKDVSSPASDIIIGGKNQVTLGVFRLAANNVEDLRLYSVILSATNGTYARTLYFYNGSTLIQAIPGTNGPTAVIFAEDAMTIPANGNAKLTIKADLLPVDRSVVVSGNSVILTLSAANNVVATGKNSGAQRASSAVVPASTMRIYESRPYFAVNSSSPSGDLIPSTSTLVAIFDATADAGGDINFLSTKTSILNVKVDASATATTVGYITLTLKDQSGNILGVDSVTFGSGTSIIGGDGLFNSTNSFGYTGTSAWEIAAGTTEKLYLYANTTDLTASNNFIQVWLDDTAAHCTFAIEGLGTHAAGDYIFKNDILANSLVRP